MFIYFNTYALTGKIVEYNVLLLGIYTDVYDISWIIYSSFQSSPYFHAKNGTVIQAITFVIHRCSRDSF